MEASTVDLETLPMSAPPDVAHRFSQEQPWQVNDSHEGLLAVAIDLVSA